MSLNSDGSFTLQNVLPGPYTLLALENGWDLEWSRPDVLQPYLANGTPIVVTAGAKPKLTVEAR